MRWVAALLGITVAGLAGADKSAVATKAPSTARVVYVGKVQGFSSGPFTEVKDGKEVTVMRPAYTTVLRAGADQASLTIVDGSKDGTILNALRRSIPRNAIVAEGILSHEGGSALKLVADKARVWNAEKDKGLEHDRFVVEGKAICGKCDLGKADVCTLAVENGKAPIVLEGKLAEEHADGKGTIRATGKLRVQKDGLLRLDAEQVAKIQAEKQQ